MKLAFGAEGGAYGGALGQYVRDSQWLDDCQVTHGSLHTNSSPDLTLALASPPNVGRGVSSTAVSYLRRPFVVSKRGVQRGVPALGGDVATLVQSSRHAYTNSWYIREPRRLAGVAGFKAFSESVGGSYTFELIAVGNTDNTDSAGPLNTGSEAGRSPFG